MFFYANIFFFFFYVILFFFANPGLTKEISTFLTSFLRVNIKVKVIRNLLDLDIIKITSPEQFCNKILKLLSASIFLTINQGCALDCPSEITIIITENDKTHFLTPINLPWLHSDISKYNL